MLLWDSSTTAKNSINSQVLVRAAHMEIATPSIETQLRQLITQEKVTHAICVPYFLSPGKHATIDVPNLIREAQSRLDEEGLLEYYDDDGNADGKRRLVEIYTTKSVGSHVDCMLNVVNDLVRVALEERDDGGDSIIFQQLGTHLVHRQAYKGQSSPDTERTHGNTNVTNEVQKYSNRAALLENVLQLNTKQLKTMTNRAMLMENAMKKVRLKWRTEKEEICEARDKQENIFVEQVANLTATIEASNLEKETMIQTFEIQRINMEREYNTTIGDLEAKVKSMEHELRRIVDGNRRAELLRTEERKSYNLEEEEELEEKCRQQQLQIQELQTKLADLLDAHNQLEQLHDDTESAMRDQQDKLKELNAKYESNLKAEQEEKEIFRIKWMDAQRQLEQDSARLHRMLNETTSRYEALLEEERGKAHEWKGKWEAMNDEQSRLGNLETSCNSTVDQPNGSAAIEQELKEAATFNADAIDRIQALEEELSQQKEQYESSSVRNEEQQQQLQKYLRAQLSTYYETIQSQILQITNYEEQIADMSQRHNESMLIATSSVEASQRREENLLTNIEELENELLIARSEMDSRQNELSDLQTRLHKMEDLRLQSDNMLEKRNDELTAKIELLERKVIAVTQQKDQALAENISIVLEKSEMFGKADLDASSSPSLSNNPQHQRFKWVRVIFRPLALFRRKRDVR